LRLNNEHLNYLKVILSDNETEFRNASFNEFCLEYGTDQQFSAPRVPQQNGVMEQKNRTLVEMLGRCSMSIGLVDAFRPMLSTMHAISLIESSYARFYI
jgi:transposase InsO family protein